MQIKIEQAKGIRKNSKDSLLSESTPQIVGDRFLKCVSKKNLAPPHIIFFSPGELKNTHKNNWNTNDGK